MKELVFFIYRILHFLLRHAEQWDQRIQERLLVMQRDRQKYQDIFMEGRNPKDPFFGDIRIITHAGGGMQGLSYLNCSEAMEHYYAHGNRIFELDVQRSADGAYVLAHHAVSVTEKAFLSQKIDRRFSPMKIADVLQFMENYDDMIVVFDCKFDNLGAFARYLQDNGPQGLHERMVIQVFREKDIIDIRTVCDFNMLFVCMYNTDYQQTAQLCLKHNIGAVSMPQKAMRERSGWQIFSRINVCMFAYTINSLEEYAWVGEQGATGAFSDFLLQSDVQGM